MRFCPSLKFCQKNKHHFFTDFQYFCSKNSFCTKIIAKGTSDFKTMWAVLCYVLIFIFNFYFCFYFYLYFYFLFFIFIGCLYFYFCILMFVLFHRGMATQCAYPGAKFFWKANNINYRLRGILFSSRILASSSNTIYQTFFIELLKLLLGQHAWRNQRY